MHSCGQRVFDKRIIFKDKTQKYVHNTFYWWLSKSFSRNKVASKVSRFKKGTTRRFVIDARTTTHPPPRARRRARFARTNPFPTPNSHRDGSNAFARVSSGAIELRAILSGCASTRTTKTLFSSIQSFPGGARLFAPNFWDDGTAADEIVVTLTGPAKTADLPAKGRGIIKAMALEPAPRGSRLVIKTRDIADIRRQFTILPKDGKVVVEGVNMIARHRKPNQQNPQGGIDRYEAPMHIAKVAVADPKDGAPTRVRIEERDGKKVRVAVKSGETIDG